MQVGDPEVSVLGENPAFVIIINLLEKICVSHSSMEKMNVKWSWRCDMSEFTTGWRIFNIYGRLYSFTWNCSSLICYFWLSTCDRNAKFLVMKKSYNFKWMKCVCVCLNIMCHCHYTFALHAGIYWTDCIYLYVFCVCIIFTQFSFPSRFSDASAYYHKEEYDGLVKACKLALHQKYPKYSTEGFEALYSRPPVIYFSAAAPPNLGQSLCMQVSCCYASLVITYGFISSRWERERERMSECKGIYSYIHPFTKLGLFGIVIRNTCKYLRL